MTNVKVVSSKYELFSMEIENIVGEMFNCIFLFTDNSFQKRFLSRYLDHRIVW